MSSSSVLIVGLGARGKLIVEALSSLAGIGIVVVESKAQSTWPQESVRLERCLEDLVPYPPFDLAIVATPTVSHADIVEKLELQCKVLLVEKPAGSSLGECDRIADVAPAGGAYVGYSERFNGPFREAVSRLLDRQTAIGGDLTIRRERPAPANRCGDPVLDLLVHDLDAVMRRVAGEVTVTAFRRSDRHSSLSLRREDGKGTIHLQSAFGRTRCTRIEISDAGHVLASWDSGAISLVDRLGTIRAQYKAITEQGGAGAARIANAASVHALLAPRANDA